MRNFNFHLLVKLFAGIWLKNRQTCFQKMSTQALFCDIDMLRVQSYTNSRKSVASFYFAAMFYFVKS